MTAATRKCAEPARWCPLAAMKTGSAANSVITVIDAVRRRAPHIDAFAGHVARCGSVMVLVGAVGIV